MYRFMGIGVLTQEKERFKKILNFGQNFRASPPLKTGTVCLTCSLPGVCYRYVTECNGRVDN